MGDQDTDAAIYGGVMQTNLCHILDLAFDSDFIVRREATALISIMLKQVNIYNLGNKMCLNLMFWGCQMGVCIWGVTGC